MATNNPNDSFQNLLKMNDDLLAGHTRTQQIIAAAVHVVKLRRAQRAAGVVGAQTRDTSPPATHTQRDEIQAMQALDQAVGKLLS